MPKKLKNLVINRVDLVDAGDNPEAFITLFKRKEEEGGWQQALDGFIKKLENLLFEKGDGKKVAFNLDEFLKNLPEDQRVPLQELLQKAEDNSGDTKDAEIAGLKEKIAELEARLKDVDKSKPPVDDVMKDLPEEIRKRLEESDKRADEALEKLQKMQDQAETVEYLAKARQFDSLPVKPEEFGLVLKSIAKANLDAYTKVEAVLLAANEACKKGNIIDKQIGSDGADSGGDAWAAVEAKAGELMKSNPSMTKEQAQTKVLRDNPELYGKYQKELRGEE